VIADEASPLRDAASHERPLSSTAARNGFPRLLSSSRALPSASTGGYSIRTAWCPAH
jgi:hypothetical protein